ncbi:MAG TPA: hypothetical protein VFC31_04295 [Candidatus Limnocylindria bacterium]|nr:hypothetical protein [Candidatus Limnocylindria bacterium]
MGTKVLDAGPRLQPAEDLPDRDAGHWPTASVREDQGVLVIVTLAVVVEDVRLVVELGTVL